MSKSTLRKDKTCLNCNYVVENRFCPNCGQENTDTRKTFHHLFIHFFEDLTHYENAFWKTIKNLFLKPSALTREYLSGKRLSYLAPVRLYIFISFVTFFIIAIFPNDDKNDLITGNQKTTVKTINKEGKVVDSVVAGKKMSLPELLKKNEEAQEKLKLSNAEKNKDFINFGYDNVKELDSLQKFGPKKDKLSDFEYDLVKKTLVIKEKNTQSEILEKFLEAARHNFPKVLFIYMPMFAFILWLFHGKRRWFYFDHGIFTLHYFSFLLLSALLIFFFRKLMNCFPENSITSAITYAGIFASYVWMFYYFFPAHHRFYGETRTISILKSLAMLFINIILMSFVMLAFVVYTFINIH